MYIVKHKLDMLKYIIKCNILYSQNIFIYIEAKIKILKLTDIFYYIEMYY